MTTTDASGAAHAAAARFREVLADNPRNVFALDKLAELQIATARPAEAVTSLRRMLALGCDRPGVRQNLALAHALLGERDEAYAQAALYEAQCPPGDAGPAKLRAAIEERLSR